MNFLVNLYLSEQKKDRIIGNFILQVIRKHDLNRYDKDIIDAMNYYDDTLNFIYSHPAFVQSMNRLNPKMRKSGKMIISIFYDHFLAANWNAYSVLPMKEYIQQCNNTLLENQDILPYKINHNLPELLNSPILNQIHTVGGLHAYMIELTRIIKVNIIHEGALNDLMTNYSAFKEDFNSLMEDLLIYTHSNRELMAVNVA
ncbi:MAG: ACP phosphodiesterase [Cytophagaceae bacterium]